MVKSHDKVKQEAVFREGCTSKDVSKLVLTATLSLQLVDASGVVLRFADDKPVRLSVGSFEADAVSPLELLDVLLNQQKDWLRQNETSEFAMKLVRFDHR